MKSPTFVFRRRKGGTGRKEDKVGRQRGAEKLPHRRGTQRGQSRDGEQKCWGGHGEERMSEGRAALNSVWLNGGIQKLIESNKAG